MRDRELQRETFSYLAPYLRIDGKASDDVPYWPSEYGVQLTRGFRALKVWATLSQLGRQGVRGLVVRHNALAQRHPTANHCNEMRVVASCVSTGFRKLHIERL